MQKIKCKGLRVWALFGIILLLLAAAFWEGLTVNSHTLPTEKVTASVKLMLLTDLHSTIYGSNQQQLIRAIRKQQPDVILLVGDIADDEVPHDGTVQLLSVIGREYPCYYVTGNHEIWSGEAEDIKQTIRSFDVTVLEGESTHLTVRGQTLQICGVDDPARFDRRYRTPDEKGSWEKQLASCRPDKGAYSILLSHRPEKVEYYRDSGFDLVLSGHAHGGQFRIPLLLKGLYAPGQGWFPAYTAGAYDLNNTTLLVSRGLARDKRPRIFNPPELVMITLTPSV